MHENHVAHRFAHLYFPCSPSPAVLISLAYFTSETVRQKTSCSTRPTCILNRSTPLKWGEIRIFAARQKDIHEPGVLHDIFSSILAFPDGTILPPALRWISRYMEGISLRRNFRMARHHTIHSPLMFTTLGI